MLLNLSQTAEKLGISDTSVKRLVEAGSLPAVPYGKQDGPRKTLRFNESDVQAFRRARIQTHAVAAPNNNGHAVLAATPAIPEGWKTTKEAADALGWKQQRVIDMIRHGKLNAEKIGHTRYVPASEIERAKAWPKSGQINGASSAPAEPVPTPAAPELVAPMPTGLKVLTNRLTAIESHQATIEMRLTAIETALNALVKAFA